MAIAIKINTSSQISINKLTDKATKSITEQTIITKGNVRRIT